MTSAARPILITCCTVALGCWGLVYFLMPSENAIPQEPTISAAPIAKAVVPTKQGKTQASQQIAKQGVPQNKDFPKVQPKASPGEMQHSRGGEAASFSQATPPFNPAPAAPAMVTAEELAVRAERVEKEANRELKRLIPLLNLTTEQQDKVFDRLAQNSLDWHPAFQMSSVGHGAPSVGNLYQAVPTTTADGKSTYALPDPVQPPTKPLVDLLTEPTVVESNTPNQADQPVDKPAEEPILTPDQEEKLLTDDLDRSEWWDEFVTNVKNDMEKTPATPPVNQEPAEKVIQGSDAIAD